MSKRDEKFAQARTAAYRSLRQQLSDPNITPDKIDAILWDAAETMVRKQEISEATKQENGKIIPFPGVN